MSAREEEGNVPRIRMIIPIWGSEYIERWLDFTFAALRSEGNVLYLNQNSDFELAILTMAADIVYMQGDPRFLALTNGIRVRFIAMDEFFPIHGKTPYGVPLTLAYAKGIMDLGDKAVGTYVIIFNADVIVSSGSFKSVLDKIREGYTAIGAPGLRAIDGDARAALYKCIDKNSGVLSIASRELMELANASLHGTVGSRTINEAGPIDTFYFHQLYWRISDDCIASRCFLLHPLCFRIEQAITKVLCPVDYGFITEMCPNARFGVLDDSDDFMALELQARDSEGHLLRLAHKGENSEQRLARLSDEITTHAATWATEEHRRNATFTIFFHAKDLPVDIARRVAPFECLVDGVLDKLPPAVSHYSHFQWLPAVRNYRQDMFRANSNSNVSLLDDPRNLSSIVDMHPQVGAAPGPSRPNFPARLTLSIARWSLGLVKPFARKVLFRVARMSKYWHRYKLGAMIEARLLTNGPGLDVIYLDNIRDHARPPRAGAQVFDLGNPSGPDQRRDFSVALSNNSGSRHSSEAVVIYAPAGFLSLWDRLSEDIERFFINRRQVVLVLIQSNFGSLNVAAHAYMLSILLSSFPSRKYDVEIDVYLGSKKINLKMFLAQWFAFLNLVKSGLPPENFSALVVSAKSRSHIIKS